MRVQVLTGAYTHIFRFTDKQVLESLSWSRGKHAYKFGGELGSA